MNQKDLMEYVSMVTDMENNSYLQNALLAELKTLSDRYGLPQIIPKPSEPVFTGGNDSFFDSYFLHITSATMGALLCFFGLKLMRLISRSFFAFLCGIVLVMLGGIFIFATLVMIPDAAKGQRQAEEAASQHSIDMKNYNAALVQYEQDILADKARVEREINEKRFVDAEIESVKKRLEESKKRLQEMYDLGVIYPKYRNLIMLNSICEYLESGRCTSLDGPTGAYNILENEMRLDRIILQLDQVIERLDQIRANQYLLYSAIQTANDTVREIAQSTEEILVKIDGLQMKEHDYTQQIQALQATSSLAAYNLERVNKELHYMNRMKYYAGEYNGTFFNQLP